MTWNHAQCQNPNFSKKLRVYWNYGKNEQKNLSNTQFYTRVCSLYSTATNCEHKILQFLECKFCGFLNFTNEGKNISAKHSFMKD